MAVSTVKALFVVAAASIFIQMVAADNHTVGAPNGSWDLRTNLSNWASATSFKVGDNLVFIYDKSAHDVLEVSKSNFDSCTNTGPIKTYKSGKDIILLSSTGDRYFICGVPTHCANGMKLEVNTVSASTTSPAPESGTPGGGAPPSAANRRILEGKVAAAGLVGIGIMVLMAL